MMICKAKDVAKPNGYYYNKISELYNRFIEFYDKVKVMRLGIHVVVLKYGYHEGEWFNVY